MSTVPPPRRPPSADPEGAQAWIDLLRRRWPAGLVLFVLVMGAAAALVFLSHPVHRAEAKLRLGAPPPQTGVSPTTGILGLWGLGGDAFANDVELLESRTVAEGVVEDVALNAHLRAPRGWYRDSIFVALAATRATDRATFRVEWEEGDEIRVARTAPTDSLVGVVAAGEEVVFGGVRARFQPWRAGMPRRVQISTEPFAEAVRKTGQRLTAERTRREANVLDLRFDDTDPDVSEAVVQAAVDRFMALRAAIHRRESGETVDSLRAVAEKTMAELRAAEEALEAFQSRTRLVAPELQGEAFQERYSEAVTRLAEVRFELEAIGTLMERVRVVDDPGEAWAELTAHPRFLENETVGALLSRLTELEARRRELATRRTETSREYRILVDEIENLDRTLQSLARGQEVGLREQLARFEALVAEMDRELAGLPPDAIELTRHQRSVRLLTEVLVVTEQRLRQEELREALTFANIQIVDPPALRDRPVWPRKKLGLAVGFLFASLFACLGMIVVDRADRTVGRASDVRSVIGSPVLAAVPGSRNGRVALDPGEIAAVLARAGAVDGGARGLVLAPADPEASATEIARMLGNGSPVAGENGAGEGSAPPREAGAGPGGPRIEAVGPLVSYAAASEAARRGLPVALVVRQGRTRRADLRRAAELLAEAGATVAGVIVICSRSGKVEDVWK